MANGLATRTVKLHAHIDGQVVVVRAALVRPRQAIRSDDNVKVYRAREPMKVYGKNEKDYLVYRCKTEAAHRGTSTRSCSDAELNIRVHFFGSYALRKVVRNGLFPCRQRQKVKITHREVSYTLQG